jgi:hypothetical protein
MASREIQYLVNRRQAYNFLNGNLEGLHRDCGDDDQIVDVDTCYQLSGAVLNVHAACLKLFALVWGQVSRTAPRHLAIKEL